MSNYVECVTRSDGGKFPATGTQRMVSPMCERSTRLYLSQQFFFCTVASFEGFVLAQPI